MNARTDGFVLIVAVVVVGLDQGDLREREKGTTRIYARVKRCMTPCGSHCLVQDQPLPVLFQPAVVVELVAASHGLLYGPRETTLYYNISKKKFREGAELK